MGGGVGLWCGEIVVMEKIVDVLEDVTGSKEGIRAPSMCSIYYAYKFQGKECYTLCVVWVQLPVYMYSGGAEFTNEQKSGGARWIMNPSGALSIVSCTN